MLRTIRFRDAGGGGARAYPFDLPALAGVTEVELTAPVTFLVGENGSGKSTLLEALAVASRLPTVGTHPAHEDPTLAKVARLADSLRLGWKPRLHRGFFLRAEDVFGFLLALRRDREVLESEMKAADDRLRDASDYARTLGLGPYRASLSALRSRYGDDPDARSHGETFLHLFRQRMVPGGLFLMDEPEAALSPQSQLALVALMADAVREGGQFVVATHSPLLLAIPGASILSFDERPVRAVSWDELTSVQLWRDVLNRPDRFVAPVWDSGSRG